MLINSREYQELLQKAFDFIKKAQYNAVVSSNYALLRRNYRIGKLIIDKSEWGNKFIDNFARDIKSEFPNSTGFSVRNLKYMKKFASVFDEDDIDEYGFAGVTWYHHMALMDKVKQKEQYIWYVEKTVENGWSRDVLVHQIETNLYERQESGKIQNFNNRLPDSQSELAIQTMKDPYIFDFVNMREKMIETDIEHELVQNVSKLLLELGTGFAFVGEQYLLKVQEDEFYIDLLFYNFKLHCFVAVDLKTGKFVPEYAGKMNFYLSVLDDMVKGEQDNPSIGLILCKDKNKVVAEYALKDMTKPIGVSEYKLMDVLPEDLQKTLPTVEDIESRVLDRYQCE
jgi:predicted nuclease of restriction endonuclease-like (RecB) superfamily